MKPLGNTDGRTPKGRRLALLSLGAAATMMLAACGGSGFEDEDPAPSRRATARSPS